MEIIYRGQNLSHPAIPAATETTLGGIKVGANLSISEDGVLSAAVGEGDLAESIAAGNGIKVEQDAETKVATVSLSDAAQTTLTQVATNTDDITALKAKTANIKDDGSLPVATDTTPGAVTPGTGLTVDETGKLNATEYTAGEGLSLTGSEFSVLVPVVPVTKTAYDALTDEEKQKNVLYIVYESEQAAKLFKR